MGPPGKGVPFRRKHIVNTDKPDQQKNIANTGNLKKTDPVRKLAWGTHLSPIDDYTWKNLVYATWVTWAGNTTHQYVPVYCVCVLGFVYVYIYVLQERCSKPRVAALWRQRPTYTVYCITSITENTVHTVCISYQLRGTRTLTFYKKPFPVNVTYNSL